MRKEIFDKLVLCSYVSVEYRIATTSKYFMLASEFCVLSVMSDIS